MTTPSDREITEELANFLGQTVSYVDVSAMPIQERVCRWAPLYNEHSIMAVEAAIAKDGNGTQLRKYLFGSEQELRDHYSKTSWTNWKLVGIVSVPFIKEQP